MIRGLYNAASGMVALTKRMDVATNNLANVQTTGFKQELTAVSTYAEQALSRQTQGQSAQIGSMAISDVTEAPQIDYSQGSLQSTGRQLDFALTGPGFFTLQTPDGIRFTRDGAFTRNSQGVLTNSSGRYVLGANGPIQLPDGAVGVSPDGTVSVDDVPVDKLRISEFDPSVELKRFGNNELAPQDPGAAPRESASSGVYQGYIEASNVDVTASMTTIMAIQRAYEANQRMIQSQDDLVGRAVNDIARPVA